jgi:LacI family transcriptional regulator
MLIEPPGEVSARRSTDSLPINDPDVVRAVRFIREHAGRPIGVEDLLEHTSLTRRTFERRFRTVTGHSPLEAIHRAHIDRAKDLLAKTDRTVHDIVAEAGFGNANRFGIAFKERVGMTPTAYRRQFRPQ